MTNQHELARTAVNLAELCLDIYRDVSLVDIYQGVQGHFDTVIHGTNGREQVDSEKEFLKMQGHIDQTLSALDLAKQNYVRAAHYLGGHPERIPFEVSKEAFVSQAICSAAMLKQILPYWCEGSQIRGLLDDLYTDAFAFGQDVEKVLLPHRTKEATSHPELTVKKN